MSEPPEQEIVAQGGIQRLRELQAVLGRDGIDSELLHPPGESAGG